MISLLHIALDRPSSGLFTQPFLDELSKIGELAIVENGRGLSDEEKIALLQKADVALTGWDSAPLPAAIVQDPGSLRYVCNLTGEMRLFVPSEIIASDILVSNWGDSPAVSIAEGTVALLLAVLKDLHQQIIEIREGGWGIHGKESGGTLYNTTVGVYGSGAIGSRFINLIRPFGSEILVYDPYCPQLPEGSARVDTLHALFQRSQIIVICAGLSDETRLSVSAELLAMLPRYGVIINTARGGIVDQDALFSELASGRLRAGLDVLEPDKLHPDHPARTWKNCIFSAHEINRGWPADGSSPPKLAPLHHICLDNLAAFVQGRPIRFLMDPERFKRSS
jgi:phosphoglycerate dehydrogenase-like enzyme